MQSLEDIPTWFSDYMGISLGAAQVLLSIVVILAVLLPVLFFTKGKGLTIPALMFVLTEAVLVGISWLPSWMMVISVCIVALGIAKFGSGIVGG